MDLSNFTLADKPVTLELVNPATGTELLDDKGNKMTLSLVGLDSKQYQEKNRSILNKRLRQPSAVKSKVKATAEEFEASSIELLAACVIGWKNIQWDGAYLEFSKENALRLLTEVPFIKDSVDEFVHERSNFISQ